MSAARLTSRLLASALIRRVEAEGGQAAVLARGDESAGAIIVALAEAGRTRGLRERALGPNGAYLWVACGPEPGEDETLLADYLARRRRLDPDLWIVELALADAEAVLAELVGIG